MYYNKKMNRIIPLLLCIVCVACSEATKLKTDYERLNLQNKVRLITETYFLPSVSGDTVRRGERTVYASSFIESIADEPFASYETQVGFDTSGNLVECRMDDSASDFHFREMYIYDGGRLIEKHGFLSDTFFYKELYRYDSRKRVKYKGFYDGENHLFESVTTRYPDDDRMIETIHTENEHSDIEYETLFNDGLPISLTGRIYNTQIIGKWIAEYDDRGRVIRSLHYDPDDQATQITEYVYDEYGNELEYSVFADGGVLLTRHECQYKYDIFGNWTQQIIIDDGLPQIIRHRNIVYY
jgi:hypothetical protein